MLERKTKTPGATMSGQDEPISQHFTAPFTYQVHFTEDAFAAGNPILEQALVAKAGKATSFICFVDSEVLKSHR